MEIIQRGKTEGGYWYEANNISAAEHGGTHMGALHTFEGRWQVDQIPLKHLITPGVVVDVRSKPEITQTTRLPSPISYNGKN
tara:strand:+ start:2123 stop:2368 length:246 start_codon:yes stop_codon:yes gene_type:complete